MSDLKSNLKRQIEILGLVLTNPGKYSIGDFQCLFDCSDITIKRDLRLLRKEGIDIHSTPKKGIIVFNKITQKILQQLLEDYVLLCHMEGTINKAVTYLINQKNEMAVSLITTIQWCIENNFQLEFEYLKAATAKPEQKIVDPLMIFEKENQWRLLAISGGIKKQYLLEKILSAKPTENSFTITDPTYIDLVKNSFGPWIGENDQTVKLKFTTKWLSNGKQPQLTPNQKIETLTDGSKIVTFSACYLQDVARWVLARGGEVIAIEPESLRDLVKKIAVEALSAHT